MKMLALLLSAIVITITSVPLTNAVSISSAAFPDWCVTYNNPTAGSLLLFTQCDATRPKQNSWRFTPGPNGSVLECINNLNICTKVNVTDRRLYLAVKDVNDKAQQWIPKGGNQVGSTIVATGSDFCAAAIVGPLGNPNHVAMRKCEGGNKAQEFYIN